MIPKVPNMRTISYMFVDWKRPAYNLEQSSEY